MVTVEETLPTEVTFPSHLLKSLKSLIFNNEFKSLTLLQMAYFLNALYTMFDSVTDKYNIFKVFNMSCLFWWKSKSDLFPGWQSEWHTHDCLGGAREEWRQTCSRCFKAETVNILDLFEHRLCISEIATMALDLLNTSSGLRTPDRNRPTDRIQVIIQRLIQKKLENYVISSFERAFIRDP